MTSTLEQLSAEYRPTMGREVLHSWALDVVTAINQPSLTTDLIKVLGEWLSNAEAGFLDEIPRFKPDVYQNQLVADTVAVLERAGYTAS